MTDDKNERPRHRPFPPLMTINGGAMVMHRYAHLGLPPAETFHHGLRTELVMYLRDLADVIEDDQLLPSALRCIARDLDKIRDLHPSSCLKDDAPDWIQIEQAWTPVWDPQPEEDDND